jgi:hypothetical protein
MAREAGNGDLFDGMQTDFLKAFEAFVRADEREETNRKANASWTLMCEKMVAAEREAIIAKLLEIGALEDGEFIAAIRARGNT